MLLVVAAARRSEARSTMPRTGQPVRASLSYRPLCLGPCVPDVAPKLRVCCGGRLPPSAAASCRNVLILHAQLSVPGGLGVIIVSLRQAVWHNAVEGGLFTLASWLRCGARSRGARRARRGTGRGQGLGLLEGGDLGLQLVYSL